MGASLEFRGLVHYHYGGNHGSMQADMVLKRELRGTPGSSGRQGLEVCSIHPAKSHEYFKFTCLQPSSFREVVKLI